LRCPEFFDFIRVFVRIPNFLGPGVSAFRFPLSAFFPGTEIFQAPEPFDPDR